MCLTRPRHAAIGLLAVLLLPVGAHRTGAEDELAAVHRLVAELRPVVAEMRGLEWKQEVPAELLSREELQAYLEAQLAKDVPPEELARDNRITKRLGILGPDEDLRELLLLMLREMAAGVYDPDSKKLYLVRGYVGDGQKPTLVHELTHALDDQHHDLLAMEEPYRERDPDRHFAIRCLFEGSAEYARRAYQDREPEVARAYYAQTTDNEELRAGQRRVLEAVPTHMLLWNLMHYRVGPNFVTRAVQGDYPGGMRRLFADPPTTQEHILHPHTWLGPVRDYPRKVVWGADLARAAGGRWRRLDHHTVGELDLAVYLDFFLGDLKGRLNRRTMGQGKFVSAMASRAARGWDAGHTCYLERDDGHIVVLAAYAFDSVRDASEAAEILGAAQRKANGDAWVGVGWQTVDGRPDRRHYDYAGRYGYGSIVQRGDEVLLLDGAPADAFPRLLPALQATTFARDPRDPGGAPADPFAGCAVVDRRRGLGLKLPNASWEAHETSDTPFSFAVATNGPVTVSFLVLDREVSRAGLPLIGRDFLRGVFREAALGPARVMGGDGLVHPIGAPPGERRALYLGSDATRTYVILVHGREDAWQEAAGEIQALLDGQTVGAPEAVGLRSVPGY